MSTTTLSPQVNSLPLFLFASILVHALLLCMPFTSPVAEKTTPRPNRLFAVELLIPESETENTVTNDSPEAPPALSAPSPPKVPIKVTENRPESQLKKTQQPREATISLNSLSDNDIQYRSYLGHLRSKINAVWEYPLAARNRGLNGTVTVRFTITKNGRLEALTIKENSPHQLLNNEALRTIRTAAPFKHFPSDFSIEKLHVLASFEYEFSSN